MHKVHKINVYSGSFVCPSAYIVAKEESEHIPMKFWNLNFAFSCGINYILFHVVQI
jgi:hypothetical protein